MLLASALALLLLGAGAGAAQTSSLTLEAIAAGEVAGRPAPQQMRWAPDGRRLSYILAREEDPDRRDLWILDLDSGRKRVLVTSEDLERLAPPVEQAVDDERERERLRRYSVAAYLWSPDGDSILFSSGGRLFLYDLESEDSRRIAPGRDDVKHPTFSPDGERIGFISAHDVWTAPLDGGAARAVTTGGTAETLHGDLDWIYPEEFGVRIGYHWSPSSRRIAFYEIDQSQEPVYPITNLSGVKASVDLQRYPQPGDPNPSVRVGWTEVEGGEMQWLDLQAEYTPRFEWIDDERLAVQLLDRSQSKLRLVEVAIESGRKRTLLTERDRYWINIADDLRFLGDDVGLLWSSERTGYRHLYLYPPDGRPRALTSGDWEVKAVEGVDREEEIVYYTANRDDPLGAALYAVGFDGRDHGAQSETDGTHQITMSPDADAFVETLSSMRDPGGTFVRAGGRTLTLDERDGYDGLGLAAPEIEEIETDDGALVRIALYRPREIPDGRKLPLILYVYGGPRAPVVRNAWGDSRGRDLFHQYLVQQGYAVALVDDRASSRLGHQFETALYRDYGPVALRDHELAVRRLMEKPFIDADRVGIWGWSGGGFATCFALTHSKLFRAGVAVAPVTDWRLYDSIYTERYMGLPAEEETAYARTSAVKAAADLTGRLLLIHGSADDNVHLQNTFALVDALIEAGKPYDLQVYPGKTHGIAGETARLHLYRAIESHFDRWLRAPAE